MGGTQHQAHLIAGVLGGGQSRRLGRDKGLIEWEGRRLIEWSVLSAQKVAQQVYVLAKDRNFYSDLACPVLPDFYSTSSPLSGILTLSPFVKEWMLLLACDIVLFSDQILPFLWEQRESGKAVVVRSEEGLQPLLGFYPAEHLGYWETAYRNANYKLQIVLEQMPRVEIDAAELPAPANGDIGFLNINRVEDLRRLERIGRNTRVK
ncbi:MAG: molybdenum cofactor guanylyltransferase [Spirochaetota bacterium]